MRRDPSDIDRLIEEGLSHYGTGDIDGALLAWERALELDPNNPQANSYVDYVRVNYDLLTNSELAIEEEGAPFAIEEEPEYEIEITGGELEAGDPAPLYMDPRDTGWSIEGETGPRTTTEPIELELVAEEPPHPEGINFEDATTEYQGKRGRPSDYATAEPTAPDPTGPEFQTEESTGGFSTSTTDVKQRNLGFVQPAGPPELPKVTVRTPAKPTTPAAPDSGRAPTKPGVPAPDDLIASLPSPRPAGTGVGLAPHGPNGGADPRAQTAQPGPATREDVSLAVAPTTDDVSVGTAPTREFAGIPTAKLPNAEQLGAPPPEPDPALNNPTRDLGMRPKRAQSTIGDEEPTRQSDVRAIREEAARNEARASAEGTKQDIVLPFDPIDARAAQILDEVDADAPVGEAKEDRTRRRISDLIERAQAWSGITELDKAVTAIELALAEDPNSALAQKLIHRNRDTIMLIFQTFLGDLERQPQLARPLHELASSPISPRAAFLLSRIDGTLTLDEILDVSGMPRLEAYRHLCQLFLRGILR